MTEQTSMQWIESGGGPLVVVPKQHIADWHGVEVDINREISDYDRACAVQGYLGVLDSPRGEVLVLGDEPFPTTWLPMPNGGFLVCWVYADDKSSVEAFLARLRHGTLPEEGGISFSAPGPCVLFDSAEPGLDIKGDSVALELRAGTYIATSVLANPTSEVRLLIHQLRRT